MFRTLFWKQFDLIMLSRVSGDAPFCVPVHLGNKKGVEWHFISAREFLDVRLLQLMLSRPFSLSLFNFIRKVFYLRPLLIKIGWTYVFWCNKDYIGSIISVNTMTSTLRSKNSFRGRHLLSVMKSITFSMKVFVAFFLFLAYLLIDSTKNRIYFLSIFFSN